MASVFRRIINRLYPDTQGHSVTILGLDYSGKTTLLYFLKLKEVFETTGGSIGFNVESVDITTASGKLFRMTGWDVGTGCGSQYMYGIIRGYLFSASALIWTVDSCDRERLSESVGSLKDILALLEGDVDDLKTLPILILANKSDKPEAMSLDEIRIKFSKVTSGLLASVFRTALNKHTVKNFSTSGLPEAFDWLNLVLEIAKSKKPDGVSPPKVSEPQLNQRAADILSHKVESWLVKNETDISSDEFLEKFKSFTLPEWDHYTHIRIAYIMLTKYGRREGKEMVFKGLEQYIANSSQTKGRSFHVTMTYFWIQIVHLGIRNMPLTPLPSNSKETTPASLDDFARFLLINPHVVDGNLWADYYSKDILMSPKAKEAMVLPDKKPLPNLVVRDAITSFGA